MEKKIVYSSDAPEPIGPYSQAVWAGNMLFVSGSIAYEESLKGNLEEEVKKIMKNIGAVLKAAGLDYSNIVKTSIFLKSMDDFTVVNEIYGQYFKVEPPARETVEVSKLPKDVNVEISVIAIKNE